jgi:hypothetical protein
MVTFLITFLFIFAFLAVAVYFWQKPATPAADPILPPPPARSLFEANRPVEPQQLQPMEAPNAAEILARARAGERAVLSEAAVDQNLYAEALMLLSSSADAPKLLSIASYISQHALPVTSTFAKAFIQANASDSDRGSIAKMLHVAAQSDDVETYQQAVQTALKTWRANKQSIPAEELATLIESEFWVLTSESRSSGAGFVLKQTLADARRELRNSN